MNPNSSMNPISVGVDEAARLIGVARSMFYEIIARGEIETFKVGRRRLVHVKALEAFVKEQARANSR